MNREKYLEMRNALINDAESLLNEGKVEESEVKMGEVRALDEKWEKIASANANIAALRDDSRIPETIDVSAETTQAPGADNGDTYLTAWAKEMQGYKLTDEERSVFEKKNKEFRNAYSHDTGNTAILIPDTVVAGIWKRAEEMYPMLNAVRKFNVRGTLTVNKHLSIEEGDAAWYDEDTEIADEKNVFGSVNLSGCELAKSITITWKLRAMATDEFIRFITQELAERIGVAAGTAIAVGKGKPGEGDTHKAEPLGIETSLLKEVATPQVVSYDPENEDPLSYQKITEAISKIHSSYLSGCAIYANNSTIWNHLANLTDEIGRPLFIPDVTSGGVGRMFGMTVKADAGVSANSIIIGNLGAGYIWNTNEPMSIATEEHVKKRLVDYAAYTIVDGTVLDNKAFALIRKTPSAG